MSMPSTGSLTALRQLDSTSKTPAKKATTDHDDDDTDSKPEKKKEMTYEVHASLISF